MNMSVSPLGIARDIAATPKVQQKCHRQRFAPKRHSTRVVSQASAQQQQTPTKNLSQEDTQRALRYQLDRSTQQTPAAVQAVQEPQYQKDLVRRQRSAREWITPWLTVKAQSRSMDTLATLRKNTSHLSVQQQDMALKRLLGQSWQVAAAHPVAVDSEEDESDIEESESLSKGDVNKYEPEDSWEDGTVLYNFGAVSGDA